MIELRHYAMSPEYYLLIVGDRALQIHMDELAELKEQIDQVLKAREEAAFIKECAGCIQ